MALRTSQESLSHEIRESLFSHHDQNDTDASLHVVRQCPTKIEEGEQNDLVTEEQVRKREREGHRLDKGRSTHSSRTNDDDDDRQALHSNSDLSDDESTSPQRATLPRAPALPMILPTATTTTTTTTPSHSRLASTSMERSLSGNADHFSPPVHLLQRDTSQRSTGSIDLSFG